VQAGAWIVLDQSPEAVFKDRVMGWRPGKPSKPLWTELIQLLGDQAKHYFSRVYGE